MKHYSEITKRYLKKQKKRSILTCIGIILSVALICGVGTLLVSFKQIEIDSMKKNTGDFHVQFKNIDYEKIKKIKTHVDTEKVGVIGNLGESKLHKEKDKILEIEGCNKEVLDMLSVPLLKGKVPAKPNEIAVEDVALEDLPKGTKIGDKITLDLGRFPKEKENLKEDHNKDFNKESKKEFVITGIIKSQVYSKDNKSAKALTLIDKYEDNKEYEAYVSVKQKKDIKAYVDEVKNSFGLSKSDKDKIKVSYNNYLLTIEGRGQNDTVDKSLKQLVIFVISIIVVCTILVIYNIFQISVIERIKQFGILRSIGATPKQIRRILLKEAGILSLISIPIGLLSGILAMKVLLFAVTKILGKMLNTEFKVLISPKVLIISSLLALATVYISAIRPAFIASRVSPLEAIRNNVSNRKGKVRRVKSNFLIKKIFKVEGEIAYKNIKVNRKRFVVTIGSMIISIVLFIVFGSMIDYGSNFNKFDEMSYRDYGIMKEKAKSESNDRIKNVGFTEKDYEKIKNINGVETVYKMFSEEYTVYTDKDKLSKRYLDALSDKEKAKKEINVSAIFNGFDSEELKLCKKKLKQGQINEDLMNKEKGVLVVQKSIIYDKKEKKSSIMEVTKLKVGDYIYIGEGKNGVKNKVKVVGILDENVLGSYVATGNIYVIATDKIFTEIQKDNTFYHMHVLLNKNANRENVTKEIRKFSNENKEVALFDTKEMLDKMNRGNLTIKIFLYGFVAVISLISSLNIINTISTNLMLRKREIAGLETIGMTQRQVKKMVYLEGVLYGIISAIIGSIIGSGLSYLLGRNVANIRGFQVSIPWKFITIAVVGAMIIALISSYFPLRRIRNYSLIENIRMEE